MKYPHKANHEYKNPTEKSELMYTMRKVFFYAFSFDTKIRTLLEIGRIKIYETYDPIGDLGDGRFMEDLNS